MFTQLLRQLNRHQRVDICINVTICHGLSNHYMLCCNGDKGGEWSYQVWITKYVIILLHIFWDPVTYQVQRVLLIKKIHAKPMLVSRIFKPALWFVGGIAIGASEAILENVQGRIELPTPLRTAEALGPRGRFTVISGRFDKRHSLQLQIDYTHFPLLHTITRGWINVDFIDWFPVN